MAKKRKVPSEFIRSTIMEYPSTNVMNKLARTVLVLYGYDKNPEDPSIENTIRQALWLIAQFPSFIAYAYIALAHKFKKESLHLHHVDPELSIAEHFLHMIRPNSEYTALEAKILDICLMIHAEHGGGE